MGLIALVAVAAAILSSSRATPDRLAFAGVRWSNDNVTSSIYMMRSDGTRLHRLTGRGAWTDSSPEWSRDGKRIAFARYNNLGWRLMVMSADAHNLRTVVPRRALADAPTWSPDGRSLAFAGLPPTLPARSISQQIYIVSIPTGHVRQLTPSFPFLGGAALPAWSRDGKRIAFSARTSLADNARADIWTIRPNGSGSRRLIRNADAPAWSPDGRRLAFARDGDIYVLTLATGAVRRITRTPHLGDGVPSWCADGRRIAFATMRRAADQAKDDMLITVTGDDGSGTRTIRDSDPNFWMDSPACEP